MDTTARLAMARNARARFGVHSVHLWMWCVHLQAIAVKLDIAIAGNLRESGHGQ
jgi:hypothetical protein